MRLTQLIFVTGLLIGFLGGGSKAIADSYVFTPINGTPTGINDSGQIVGTNAGGDFLRSASGNMQSFNVPGGTTAVFPGYQSIWPFTVGLGINNLGEVVGNGTQGVFLRASDGTIQWFGVPAGTLITGINDTNAVVGYQEAGNGPCLPSDRLLCGVVGDLNGNFVAFNAVFETFALGINDSGQVVGLTHNVEEGFLRNPDGTLDFFLGGGISYLAGGLGISNTGQIAGGVYCDFFLEPSPVQPGCEPFQSADHGFIRQTDGSLTFINYPRAANTILTGINDNGEIIGYTWGTGAVGGFLATPVPEPASLPLLGTVVACLGALVQSRKARG